MLNVNLQELLKGGISRYELVAATAQRARQIVEEAEKDHEIVVEKPVSIAVREYMEGLWTIDPDQDIPGRPQKSEE